MKKLHILIAICAVMALGWLASTFNQKELGSRSDANKSVDLRANRMSDSVFPPPIQTQGRTNPLRARTEEPFATEQEVLKFLETRQNCALSHAVCGALAGNTDLILRSRELEPNNESIELIWLLFNANFRTDSALLKDFAAKFPNSTWPLLLQSKAELDKGNLAQSLDSLHAIKVDSSFPNHDTEARLIVSEFLTEIRGIDPLQAATREAAVVSDTISGFSFCKNLVQDLRNAAEYQLVQDPDGWQDYASASWDISERIASWGYAYEAWFAAVEQINLAKAIGYDKLERLLGIESGTLNQTLRERESNYRALSREIRMLQSSGDRDRLSQFQTLTSQFGQLEAMKIIKQP